MFNINILLEYIFIKKNKALPFKENQPKDVRANYDSTRFNSADDKWWTDNGLEN